MERRQSPRVYRNRRIAAGLALLLVIGAIWGIIAGVGSLLGGSEKTPTASAQPSATASSTASKAASKASASASKSAAAPSSSAKSSAAKPSASAAPVEYPLCYPEYLGVEMSTDKESYAPKEKPVLIMKITNLSQESCVADVGTQKMAFVLSSGSAQVFSSQDCQVKAQSLLRKIDPGKSETARFTWQRNATLPGCATVDPSVPGQKITGGTYQLTGKLGDLTSAPVTFDLAWE